MSKAIIYKPTKNAMQSGKGKTKKWILEFERKSGKTLDNLIGWKGGADMNQEIRLSFETKDAAIKYAESNDLIFEIIAPKERKIKIQSYADNFQ